MNEPGLSPGRPLSQAPGLAPGWAPARPLWCQVDLCWPWLAPWRATALPVLHGLDAGLTLHDALNQHPWTQPVRFVPQANLPPGMAYEDYIFHSKNCPIREGLHDFFNGLCWMRFPHIKQRLNQLQAQELKLRGASAPRGPVRDAITVLDENAAFLHAPPALWEALLAKDWRRLFVELRPLWREAQLLLFGHALLEKLVSPRKAMVAHIYRPLVAIEFEANSPASLDRLDAGLAQDLTASHLAGKPFAPMPVLGVPGWWPANDAPGFYDDAQVFRPPIPWQ